jgi:hypothetical protein
MLDEVIPQDLLPIGCRDVATRLAHNEGNLVQAVLVVDTKYAK